MSRRYLDLAFAACVVSLSTASDSRCAMFTSGMLFGIAFYRAMQEADR